MAMLVYRSVPSQLSQLPARSRCKHLAPTSLGFSTWLAPAVLSPEQSASVPNVPPVVITDTLPETNSEFTP